MFKQIFFATAIFALSALPAFAIDVSLISRCVKENDLDRADPIERIDVTGASQNYYLITLHSALDPTVNWEAILRLQGSSCEVVYVNPDDANFAIASERTLPESIAVELVRQRIQGEIKANGKDVVFDAYNGRTDDNKYLYMQPEEYKALKLLGFKPKYPLGREKHPSF